MTDRELLQQALDVLKMSYELQDIGWVDFEAYKLTCDADILSKLNITIDVIKARLAQPEPRLYCEWERYDDVDMPDTWQGQCGALWTFTEGSPTDNDMIYCPCCGGKLKEGNDD